MTTPAAVHGQRFVTAPYLTHGLLGWEAKFGIQLMSHLYSKLEQAAVEELQLAIVWQCMPVNAAMPRRLLKGLHIDKERKK